MRVRLGSCLAVALASSLAMGASLFDVVRSDDGRIAVDRLLAPLEAVAFPTAAFKLVDAVCDDAVARFEGLTGTPIAGAGQPHGVSCYLVRLAYGEAPTFHAALDEALGDAGFALLRDDHVESLGLRRQAWQGERFAFAVIFDGHLAPDVLMLVRIMEAPGE